MSVWNLLLSWSREKPLLRKRRKRQLRRKWKRHHGRNLTLSKVSDVLVIADHTLIPDTMRGTGAASALVGDLIADARAKGYRIVPLCLFAGQMMVFRPGDRIGLIAGESGARLMVLGGETMNGPRYITWNFVASSKKKIDAAKQAWRKGDWEHGRFRLPPGDEAEFIPLPDRLK